MPRKSRAKKRDGEEVGAVVDSSSSTTDHKMYISVPCFRSESTAVHGCLQGFPDEVEEPSSSSDDDVSVVT